MACWWVLVQYGPPYLCKNNLDVSTYLNSLKFFFCLSTYLFIYLDSRHIDFQLCYFYLNLFIIFLLFIYLLTYLDSGHINIQSCYLSQVCRYNRMKYMRNTRHQPQGGTSQGFWFPSLEVDVLIFLFPRNKKEIQQWKNLMFKM